MAMQTTGIDVEAGGDDAPVVTGTPVEAGRENEAPVVTGAPVLSRQLSGAAVQQRAQQALTGPTAESPQKSSSDLFYSAAMQAILPVILLTNYYRQEWGDRYCSTDVAEWFFVFGWIGAASVLYAYLVNVWFWRIQWDDFARSSDEGKQKILKRLKRVQAPNTALAIANFVWFCVGQERIWGTHACDMDEYDMIMAMNSTVRPAARAPASRPPARPLAPHAPTRLPAHSRPAHSPAHSPTPALPHARAELHLRRPRPAARPVVDRVLRRHRLLLPAHARLRAHLLDHLLRLRRAGLAVLLLLLLHRHEGRL